MRFSLRLPGRSPEDRRPRVPEQDGAWIAANRRSFFDYSVGSLVPVVFERYARVLHPAWAAGDQPVRWDEVAAWSGRTIHRLAQWEFISRPLTDPHSASPFVQPPRPHGLPPPHLAVMCDLLAAHTSTLDQCFVAVWEGYGWLEWSAWRSSPVLLLDQRTFLVRRGSIELAQAVGYGAPSGTRVAEPPTILWPADRAWFVASDPDLDSTYCGGSDALIESLLAHRDLEAWPAEPVDRVAVDSDEINAP